MTPEQRKHFEYVRDVMHGGQCPSCGGFCKESGCERENEVVKAVMVFIDEFTGAEQERHPMFSEGYDYALSQVQQIIETKLKEKNTPKS